MYSKDIDIDVVSIKKLKGLKKSIKAYINDNEKKIDETIFESEKDKNFLIGINLLLDRINHKIDFLIGYKQNRDVEGFKNTLHLLFEDVTELNSFTKEKIGLSFGIVGGILAVITGILLAIILPIIKSKKSKAKNSKAKKWFYNV